MSAGALQLHCVCIISVPVDHMTVVCTPPPFGVGERGGISFHLRDAIFQDGLKSCNVQRSSNDSANIVSPRLSSCTILTDTALEGFSYCT